MMKYKGKYWVKEQKGYRGRKGQGGYLVPSWSDVQRRAQGAQPCLLSSFHFTLGPSGQCFLLIFTLRDWNDDWRYFLLIQLGGVPED
jgi:hypothetical protein